MPEVLDTIRTGLRDHLAAPERRGATLASVAIERLVMQRAIGFSWALNQGHGYLQVEVREDWDTHLILPMFTPIVLTQLFREAFHAANGHWEGFIPPGGVRYGVRFRLNPRGYRAHEEFDVTEPPSESLMMRVSYDPLYARDPEGAELRDGIDELRYRMRAAATQPRQWGDNYHVTRIEHILAFRPYQERRAEPPRPMEPNTFMDNAFDRAMRALDTLDSFVRPKSAEQRGWALLREHLTEQQIKDLDEKKCFDVIGGTTGDHYRIHCGKSYNIDLLDRFGERADKLCFAPSGDLVTGDVMLTQKTMLELREPEALRIANRYYNTPVRVGLGRDMQDPRRAMQQQRVEECPCEACAGTRRERTRREQHEQRAQELERARANVRREIEQSRAARAAVDPTLVRSRPRGWSLF